MFLLLYTFFSDIATSRSRIISENSAENCRKIGISLRRNGHDIGVKIPVKNPSESVRMFAEVLENLYMHPEYLETMSHNCKQRCEQLSWDNKIKEFLSYVTEAIKK